MSVTRHLQLAAGPAIIAALLALVFGIAVNLAAAKFAPPSVVVTAMAKGEIESRTPYKLAPWWLRTRAQADCLSVQRLYQSSRSALDSAISPRLMNDRLGNARPCEVLAGYLYQPDMERIGKRSDHSGMAAAGSFSMLVAAILGWRGVNVLQLIMLLGVMTTCVVSYARTKLPGRTAVVLPFALATSSLALAISGSISLLPVLVVLIALSAMPLFPAQSGRPHVLRIWLPATAAALLWVLDPNAASVVAGLAVLLSVVLSEHRECWRTDGAASLVSYALGAAFAALIYIPLVLLSSESGTANLFMVLTELFADRPVAGWPFDIPAAMTKLFEWLGDGPLHSRTLAFLFIWSLPFAIFAERPLDDQWHSGNWGPRLKQFAMSCLPLAPCIVWILIHPGFVRRNPDDYALLVAVGGMVALSSIVRRLLAQSVSPQANDLADVPAGEVVPLL